MTDKELIKKEIERRQKDIAGAYESEDTEHGYKQCCKEILSFIDSLPEEPINFPHEINIIEKVFGMGNLESWEYREAEKLVLLAKEELLKDLEINKESASEDLEEAASKYVREDFHERSRADFKAGAEWQKQQMKEALQTEYEKGRFDMRGNDESINWR